MAYSKARRTEPGIFQLEDGSWLVDIRPDGSDGKRHRATWATKAEALRHKNRILAKAGTGETWQAKRQDPRRISELIEIWYEIHGRNLKDEATRHRQLKFITAQLGNPTVYQFTQGKYLEFRAKRLASGSKPNTVNHDLAYLKAMFSRLVKAGMLKSNPLINVDKLRIDESVIRYLELSEVDALLKCLSESRSDHGLILTKICLSIGCRWGEAVRLRAEHVRSGHVQLEGTKNGKSRLVPISAELESSIRSVTGGVRIGRIFTDPLKAFQNALKAANISLPTGQSTHVLRHTFSVHFMLARGNILDLQKILGHETLQMTLRYAQFHPNYLQDALTRNPLARLNELQSSTDAL